MTFIPEAEFRALQVAREREQTDDIKEAYKKRSGVEGTISQAVGVLGMRRTLYRGLDKVHLQHLMTAATINLCAYSIGSVARSERRHEPQLLPGSLLPNSIANSI